MMSSPPEATGDIQLSAERAPLGGVRKFKVDRSALKRFINDQDARAGDLSSQTVFETAMAELKAGRKTTHWIWFVFPIFAGLGSSQNTTYFAIASINEAYRYLEHEILGPRLFQAAQAILNSPQKDLTRMFGAMDWIKVRSSMTLFAIVMGDGSVFHQVLDTCFKGNMCEQTVELVGLQVKARETVVRFQIAS